MKNGKRKISSILCLLLSTVMIVSVCLAGCAKKSEKPAIPAAVFSVDVDYVSVPDEGAEIAQTLKLTSSEKIDGTLTAKDFTLGGSFENMNVSAVSNDAETISLTISGVPVLEGAPTLGYVGEIEIAGKYFDSDSPVSAGVPVLCLTDEEPESSYFYPFFESVIDNDTSKELHIILRPYGGNFADDFSTDMISFDGVLKDAQIVSLDKTEDGSELVVNINANLDIRGSENTLGSITLAKGSMTNNTEEISYTRDYSADTYGRGLSPEDLDQLKNIVQPKKSDPDGSFSSDIGSLYEYGLSGLDAAGRGLNRYRTVMTMLGAFGILKSSDPAAQAHQEIMDALSGISGQIEALQEDVTVIRSYAADNKRALENLALISTEDYLASFHAHYDAMIKYTNEIENALKQNRSKILQMAEEYSVKEDGGRAVAVVDEIQEVAEGEGEAGEDDPADAPGEDAGEETTEEVTEEVTEETTEETTEATTEETTEEEITMTDEEIAWILEEFGGRICDLKQSNYYTIGQKLQLLESEYTTAIVYLKNNNANPISRYCQIYNYTDNFSTTSLTEKELYALDLDCQFDRTLSYLMLLGGQYSQQENVALFSNSYFPDVVGEATNKNGDPYCYLMKSYVQIANDTVSAIYKPAKNITILTDEDVQEFSRRRNGRTLKEELIYAGFDENTFMNLKTNFESSDFGSGIGMHDNDRFYGIGFRFYRVNGNHPRAATDGWYNRMDGIFNYMKDDANSYTMDAHGIYYDNTTTNLRAKNLPYEVPCCGYISKGGTHYGKGWYVIEPMTYFKRVN